MVPRYFDLRAPKSPFTSSKLLDSFDKPGSKHQNAFRGPSFSHIGLPCDWSSTPHRGCTCSPRDYCSLLTSTHQVERSIGTGKVTCIAASDGPMYDQVKRGIDRIHLAAGADGKICNTKSGACDRISDFGTAGFRVCTIVDPGQPFACWDPAFLQDKFTEIINTCPISDPNSMWGTIKGQYSVATSDLPNGMWLHFTCSECQKKATNVSCALKVPTGPRFNLRT